MISVYIWIYLSGHSKVFDAVVSSSYYSPSTRRVPATRLHSTSEEPAGGEEDLTKDLPNPPQPLKVEEVHPKTRQHSSDEQPPADGEFG